MAWEEIVTRRQPCECSKSIASEFSLQREASYIYVEDMLWTEYAF